MERRYLQSRELRVSGSSSNPQISGYAAVFNSPTTITQRDGSSFRERIRRGAFSRAIREKHDCVCLFNHSNDFILGRVSAGTLRLRQDDRGLFYECDMPDTTLGRYLRESIKRKDVRGCSFAFAVREDGQEWSEEQDERGQRFVQRDITDISELIDVSPVTHPAYDTTEVSARTLELVTAELRSGRRRAPKFVSKEEIERRLRNGKPSFEELVHQSVRNRRLSILDL
jgi:uncharacterized protein